MKKIVLASAALAALIFTGCASKGDAVDTKPAAGADSMGKDSMSKSADMGMTLEKAQSMLKPVLFDFDKFAIRADMKAVVDGNSKVVNDAAIKSAKIKLEGNADERGTEEYNYALGLKRADSVSKALMGMGVDKARLSTVSYGELSPVCKDKNEACWQKNRRVDTKLSK